MTLIFGLFQFVLVAYILVKEFKSKSSVTFLWATLFIMFGVPHLIASINGDDIYSNWIISEASIFVSIFCLIYAAVRFTIASKIMIKHCNLMQYENIRNIMRQEKVHNRILFLILVVVEFLAIYPYIQFAGDIFTTSWSSGRDYSATLNYINNHQIFRIVFYSLSGLMVSAFMKNQKQLFVLVGIFLLGVVIVTRNRIEILPFFCSIISIIIFKNRLLNKKVVILGIIGAMVVIYTVYGLRVFRHYGTIADFIDRFSFSDYIGKVNLYIQKDDGELGLRKDFYYFLSQNNNFNDFGKAHSYIRMLFVYLPTRWSLGIKPDDFAIAMGQACGMQPGGSTHPTLFGDCYANLDVFGVLLGAFWALYATVVDIFVCRSKSGLSKILIYVLNGVVFVIIGRGSVYNGFWYSAYGVPLILIAEYLKNKTKLNFKFRGCGLSLKRITFSNLN